MFKFMGNMMINAYGEAANSEIYIIIGTMGSQGSKYQEFKHEKHGRKGV
jgi:hypothetical protein